MLKIQIPDNYHLERRYILSVMLSEFFGLEYQIQTYNGRDIKITANDENILLIADGLFAVPKEHWLKPASLPRQPLKAWDLSKLPFTITTVNQLLPLIFGEDPNTSEFFICSRNKIHLGLDIFGSAFFMLTCYEEVVKTERDDHNRFPAAASLAYQEGFLDRPIVNEYLEILWACLKQLWPGLQRKERHFQIYASHDVDEPFAFATISPLRFVKHCARDILIRHSPRLLLKDAALWLKIKNGDVRADPYNTFELIMDINERHNLKSVFNFITYGVVKGLDGFYNMDHPLIRALLHKIHQRGHEIGLHPSYNTFQDAAQTKKEFERLKKVCALEGIKQSTWGSRQHYLRWETPTTFQNLTDSGLSYDTTLLFADTAGFRCGVCYEFPTFNVLTRQQLHLRERPLVLMEETFFNERSMNLGQKLDMVLQTMLKYKKRCHLFNGDFTLLWHNNRFIDKQQFELYEHILR